MNDYVDIIVSLFVALYSRKDGFVLQDCECDPNECECDEEKTVLAKLHTSKKLTCTSPMEVS